MAHSQKVVSTPATYDAFIEKFSFSNILPILFLLQIYVYRRRIRDQQRCQLFVNVKKDLRQISYFSFFYFQYFCNFALNV